MNDIDTSIWTLKKRPLHEVADFIRTHAAIAMQAEMTGMTPDAYRSLTAEEAVERLANAIAAMDDESYTDYLLALIDE